LRQVLPRTRRQDAAGKTNLLRAIGHAQLICTTHNTSLLDQLVLRRDQIWFVEKGKGMDSRLCPLADLRPRNDEVQENRCLRGRYGAHPILSAHRD
jgi:AAA15 family ATPase/GTPase